MRTKNGQARRTRLPVVKWRECQRPDGFTAWLQLLHSYTKRLHIHGLNQLLLPTMRRRMRLLWCLALVCAGTVLISVCYLLAERYQRKHFRTIIANAHAPMYHIAFPVVIVCNKNRLNWSRLKEISQKYNITGAHQPLFERVLTAYDALSFRHFHVFDKLSNDTLHSLNHLNFTEIVSELAWRCDEIMLECIWQMKPRDCCKLFRPRRQPQGMCLAFNELEQRHIGDSGIGTGLIVRLLLRQESHAPNNYRPKGFVLNILQSSVWSGYPIELLPESTTRTNIGVSAVLHYFDENTFDLPIHWRRCIRDYERNSPEFRTLLGHKYMLENCIAECYQLYMLRYCNCTLDLFYPPSNYPPCRLVDLPCLAAHNGVLQNYEEVGERPYVHSSRPGMVCECMHNCHSLELLTDLRKSVLMPWQFSNTTKAITFNIYYNRDEMLIYKTGLIYTWVDLLVSFGSICQLCLGCSLISLIELCYFGIIAVPRLCWQHQCLS
ncbi:pickpocket protein 19 [Scaptodrosophila lebanonensis]|uniref:Pickpocket protein 19 n=1 Tax=Drosophila lebanonensis TaxID=7225 RepID=A0A6J2TNV7_DROLE|nr:pickpocket protein 19 [Scaptodrosophila lebanonensis]